MQNLIDRITLDDTSVLSEEQQLLINCIGLESYKKLLKEYSGSNFYVAKAENVTLNIRNKLIYDEFDGKNYKYLASKYSISERSVRSIINNMRAKSK